MLRDPKALRKLDSRQEEAKMGCSVLRGEPGSRPPPGSEAASWPPHRGCRGASLQKPPNPEPALSHRARSFLIPPEQRAGVGQAFFQGSRTQGQSPVPARVTQNLSLGLPSGHS